MKAVCLWKIDTDTDRNFQLSHSKYVMGLILMRRYTIHRATLNLKPPRLAELGSTFPLVADLGHHLQECRGTVTGRWGIDVQII